MPGGERKRSGLLLRVLLGAVGAVLAAAALVGAWLIPIQRGYGKSSRAEAGIDGRFPSADAYTPSLDGTVRADRLEAFLAVRRALSPSGLRIAEHQRRVLRMETHAQEKKVRPAVFLRDLGGAMGSFAPMVRDLGAYVEARNGALLANGMGLGEYTWLYVACYVGELGERPARVIPDASAPDLFQERVYPQVRGMISRRVEGAESAAKAGTGSAPPPQDVEAWRLELAALEADPGRIPFQDGLPAGLSASLAPFRERLAALSCPAAAEPDLTRTVRRGLSYDHR